MKNLMPLSLRHVFAKDFNISLFVSFASSGSITIFRKPSPPTIRAASTVLPLFLPSTVF